jgi:hypothetical protein
MSEKQYLENIASKVKLYADAKEQAIQWLIKKQIKDKEKIQNALIMSQIWLAHNLNEKITMADLMIYLGDDQGDFTEQDNRIIELDRDMQNMALGQVLEASVI